MRDGRMPHDWAYDERASSGITYCRRCGWVAYDLGKVPDQCIPEAPQGDRA